jgi:hypothetical protein
MDAPGSLTKTWNLVTGLGGWLGGGGEVFTRSRCRWVLVGGGSFLGKPAKLSWTELASSVDGVLVQVDDLHDRRQDVGHEVVSGGLHVTIAHHVAYDTSRVMHGRVICGWSRSSERHPCCARVTARS